jgi:hypothetical protein
MAVQFQEFSTLLVVDVNCFVFLIAHWEYSQTLQPQLLSSPLSRSYPRSLTAILMMAIIQASSSSYIFCDGLPCYINLSRWPEV